MREWPIEKHIEDCLAGKIDRKPDYKAREKVIQISKAISEADFLSMGAKIEENFSQRPKI